MTLNYRDELWALVEGLTDEELNKKIGDGKWSIAQVLEHLLLTEQHILQEIKGSLTRKETKEKPVHYTVNRSHKVEAPEQLVPSNEFHTLDSLKEKMVKSRENIEKKLEQFSEEELNQLSLYHFAFGSVKLKQWLPFIHYHEKRHIEQIKEIKDAL
jgi:uncharacterized damage-inducible protein DinB